MKSTCAEHPIDTQNKTYRKYKLTVTYILPVSMQTNLTYLHEKHMDE